MTWGRGLRILFVVVACLSLLANAFLIGLGKRLADRGLSAGLVGQVIRELPPEKRGAIREGLRSNRPEMRRLADELRARRREMLRVAAAETVDPVALAAAMEDVRGATTRLQALTHDAMLKALSR